jgi:hypothetical protein
VGKIFSGVKLFSTDYRKLNSHKRNLFDKFEMVNLSDTAWVADFVQVIAWTELLSLQRVIEITAE